MDYFQKIIGKCLNEERAIRRESPSLDDKNRFQQIHSEHNKLDISMQLIRAAGCQAFINATGLPFAPSLLQNLNTNRSPYSQNIQSIEQNTQNQYSSFQSIVCQATMQPSILQNWPLYISESNAVKNDDNKNNNSNMNNMNNSVKPIEERRIVKRRKAAARPKKQSTEEAEASVSPSPSVSSPSSITSPVSSNARKSNRQNNRQKKFRCNVCSRSFGYKHVLQNHQRTHTGEKPFGCTVCKKRFTRDHHLKTHMRLHTGEKPYCCTVCNREFVQVANLRRHVRVHTGERPYVCTICAAKFSDSNQLKSHSLIHEGEKPFECQYCNTSFTKRHHLAKHKCDIQLVNSEQRMQAAQMEQAAHSNGLLVEQMKAFDINDQETEQMIVESIEMETERLEAAIAPSLLSIEQLANPPIPIVGSDAKSEEQPVQTEPEDLSMSTGMHRSQYSIDSIESSVSPSHSHSFSPSSDIIYEENDEKREASLFLGGTKYSHH